MVQIVKCSYIQLHGFENEHIVMGSTVRHGTINFPKGTNILSFLFVSLLANSPSLSSFTFSNHILIRVYLFHVIEYIGIESYGLMKSELGLQLYHYLRSFMPRLFKAHLTINSYVFNSYVFYRNNRSHKQFRQQLTRFTCLLFGFFLGCPGD